MKLLKPHSDWQISVDRALPKSTASEKRQEGCDFRNPALPEDSSSNLRKIPLVLGIGMLAGAVFLAGCGSTMPTSDRPSPSPTLGARSKPILTVDGLQYKDLNANGSVDRYEDWRLSTDERVNDLLSKMTLDEKAGMMLIDTLNPGFGGVVEEPAGTYINAEKMTRFIFRSVVTATPVRSATPGLGGQQVTPEQAATGAILAGFGISDSALMDVITGKFKPQGKLPFALANNLDAVINNDPDAPGYPAKDTLYPFGFGLSY